MKQVVELDANEWHQVLAILATAPWATANPLIMKIAPQLQMQQGVQGPRPDGEDRPPAAKTQ